MATQTFTWQPSLDVTGSTTFLTREAVFGDGYSQSTPDGINNKSDSWPLTFVGNSAYIAPIKSFLDGLSGSTSFYWTPPLRAQGLFRVATYSLQPHGGDAYTLTVTFKEVFAP